MSSTTLLRNPSSTTQTAPAADKLPPVPPTLIASGFDGEEAPWLLLLQQLASDLLAASPRLCPLGIPLQDALEAVHTALFEGLELDLPPMTEKAAWSCLWQKAVWRARDIARRNRRAATLLPPDVLAAMEAGVSDSADVEAAQQLNTAVWEAVAELPERLRDVVICRYYEGLSVRETAAVLDIHHGSVVRGQKRAERLLRVALAEVAELFLREKSS